MFDYLQNGPGLGGFLKSARNREMPKLEPLEDREVPAIIGGVVYSDLNNNGLRNVNEIGIAGSVMQLLDNQGNVIATTTADATGRYVFTQKQSVDTTPAEVSFETTFQQARTNLTRSSTLPQFDSSLGQLTAVDIIAEGSTVSNVVLENLDPLTADMHADLNNQIRYTVGGTVVQAQKSTTVSTTLPAFDGQMDLQGTSAKDFGTTQLSGDFNLKTLTAPADLAAFMGSGTVNVSQNASVTSCACGTGNLMAMIRSTVQGKVRVVYHYTPTTSIGPGIYTIVQTTQPPTYTDGFETRDNVSKIPGTNKTDTIRVGVVNQNDQFTNNNFGELKLGSIAGMVYHDVDRSGFLNNPDIGLAGVTLLLSGTDVYGNLVNRTTTTAQNGTYGFGGLVAGTYTVREIQPANYQQGTNTLGNYFGQILGDTMTLTLPPGGAGVNYNFGEVLGNQIPPPPPPPDNFLIPTPSKFLLIRNNPGEFRW